MKNETSESMRDFVERYDRLTGRILEDVVPSENNLKRFFISALPSEVGFFLRRAQPRTLREAKDFAIDIDDDLIISYKVKGQNGKQKGQKSNLVTTNPLFQKMANDLVALKKQLSQITMRNAPRRPNLLDRPRISPPPHMISREAPLFSVIYDTRESKEGEDIEETEEQSMDNNKNYL
ncbi:hypothetical protein KI387_044154 [Taxus chinensis]|uniref:Uncharacterized protein n=1 Tax=Taxus chinensis TaxID=29808 RepID=A0AA38F6R7_TAXCH|nr:hypothetical protein KI387_044154 [Taxus chinensis]